MASELRLCGGGEDGTRTRNPRLAKAVRYQLRHFPEAGWLLN